MHNFTEHPTTPTTDELQAISNYYTFTSRLPKPEDIDYWGGCPACWRNDGYLNVGPDHWFICHKHRVRWLAGSNLFSSWREQTEDDFQANAALIGPYREVEEVTSPQPEGADNLDEDLIPF